MRNEISSTDVKYEREEKKKKRRVREQKLKVPNVIERLRQYS